MKQDLQQHGAWSSGHAADEWFERNRSKLMGDNTLSRHLAALANQLGPEQRILEIGTANGHQLFKLQQACASQAFGIDPSQAAIEDGKRRYPVLHLEVGTADKLVFPDGYFDCVIFGFCLYLVDRNLLMRIVAEADRVLKRNGKLMIIDFDPVSTHKRPFSHQAGIWSYKMNYAGLWLANPDYVLAEKYAYSHVGDVFHQDSNERVAAWLLVKQEEVQSYPEAR